MEDHLYFRVTSPPVIVVKEEPIWKLAKKEGTLKDIFCVSDEEPELEWAVSKVADGSEDPLMLSDTEESSLSVENSVSSKSSVGHSSAGAINGEKLHFPVIPLLTDDSDSSSISSSSSDDDDDDGDSLDFEVAEFLKENNGLYKSTKKLKTEQQPEEQEQHEGTDEHVDVESFDSDDGKQFKSIFQSNVDGSLVDGVQEIQGKCDMKTNSNDLIILKDGSFTGKQTIVRKNRSGKYALRSSRSVLKRYSPFDFNESSYYNSRTFKKTKQNRDVPVIYDKRINSFRVRLDKINEILLDGNSIKENKSKTVKSKRTKTSSPSNSTTDGAASDVTQYNTGESVGEQGAIKEGDSNFNKSLHDIEFNCYVDKRRWHNKMEKHRRAVLSELFLKLSSEFPSKFRATNKLAKVHTLNIAVDYIDELRSRQQYLVKTTDMLKEKQVVLKEKLAKLKATIGKR